MKILKIGKDEKQENIVEDVRNFFRLKNLKKETNDAAIKDIRNLFRLEKEIKVIIIVIIKVRLL